MSRMQAGTVQRLSDTAQFSILRRAHRTPCRSTAQQNFGARSKNSIADHPPLLLLPAPGAPSFCTGARDHGRSACKAARPVRRSISKVGIYSADAEHSDQLVALVRSQMSAKDMCMFKIAMKCPWFLMKDASSIQHSSLGMYIRYDRCLLQGS